MDRQADVLAGKEDVVERVVREIDELLPPTDETTKVHELIRQLEEILDLPIWKYRHEVYAVWLGAQIHRSLRAAEWRFFFHTTDGRLEFAFRGVHLGTLSHEHYPEELHWWTELRTDHGDLPSHRRTQGVQPDYRIRTSGADVRDLVILEAKQHLRSAAREFGEALTDYAYACPHAVILLANYGPVGEELVQRVDEKLRGRCVPFSHVNPGSEDDVSDVRTVISNGLDAALRNQPERAVPAGTVTLTWGAKPSDLDLHIDWVDGESEHIYYGALNGNSGRLVADVRIGGGPEIAFLERTEGEFWVVVRQYSPDGKMVDSGARVDVVLGFGAQRHKRSFQCPKKSLTSEAPRKWSVCYIDVGQANITELGLLD